MIDNKYKMHIINKNSAMVSEPVVSLVTPLVLVVLVQTPIVNKMVGIYSTDDSDQKPKAIQSPSSLESIV